MRILGKNGKNRRRREVVKDVSRRAIEYCKIIDDVLKWIVSRKVKTDIGAVAQVVCLREVVLIISM